MPGRLFRNEETPMWMSLLVKKLEANQPTV